MSVSLYIHKNGQKNEIISFGGQRSIENRFCPLAASLSLIHLPHIYTHYEIKHEEFEKLIEELDIMQAAMRHDPNSWGIILENIEIISKTLKGLRGSKNWEVSFG